MKPYRTGTIVGLVLCCLSWSVAFGGDETTVKGFITGRTGDTMTVRGLDSTTTTVMITDDTKVQEPEGAFRHKEMSMSALVPGLAVEVKGTTDDKGQLVAKTVRFKSSDLKTASQIQAGLVPTEQAVQANKQSIAANQENIAANKQQIAANQEQLAKDQAETQKRFNELSEYETKAVLVISDFPVGKATLSEKDKTQLSQLAQKAKGLQGYLIQVKGFCDSTGTAAQNQVLSQERAEAVIAYLEQETQVGMRHILAPGAMSTVDPVASNETAAGRAENRRVEIKVLLNKGIAG
jgi:outer membrane protein OmpA-like peptidoglycan-associated protein